MNNDQPEARADTVEALLAACDEALAVGDTPPLAESVNGSPELRSRLERGVACIKLLREMLLPPQPPPPATTCKPGNGDRSPPPPEATPALPSSLGRFQIRRELGRGAFGIVFLAHDPHLRRDVALKVPRAEALVSPEARERFLREARAAAGLEHPNVVPVYEAGEVGAVCYIASAYCPGTTLAQWLRRRDEPVAAREAAALVTTLAEAVEHAHGRHVVHRDLKPSNVLLAVGHVSNVPSAPGTLETCPTFGTPRITDFGLAKLLEGEPGASAAGAQTESGAIVGTPCYMAPEQAGGHSREVGPAADVYALGAILYEVLTGRPPFQGETTLDILLQVRTQEPVAPGSLRARLPRDLETICLKCLEKSPVKRYATAQALADDLRRFLDGRPILARPVGPAEKLWRWCRRNPVVAGLWAAVGLSLLAGIAVSTTFWLQADDRRREAESRRIDADNERARANTNEQTAKTNEENAKKEARRAFHRAYISELQRIGPAWEDRQVGIVRELLDNQRPARTGGEDLRGFEWYYWHSLCNSDLLTLTGHKSPVWCVAFSPDGRLLATGAGESLVPTPGELKLWDAVTGKERSALPGTPCPVVALAFSPDGRRLASAHSDTGGGNRAGLIRLWDVQTGELLQTFAGHKLRILALAYSPDGTLLASGGSHGEPPREQGELKVWDTATGREVFSLAGHTGPVAGVAFSPAGLPAFSAPGENPRATGTLLASASLGEVKLWDPRTGKEERTLGSGERRGLIAGLAFTPDGKLLARPGLVAGTVDFWDPRTGDWRFFLQTQVPPAYPAVSNAKLEPVPWPWPLGAGLTGVAFSPDSKRLAVAMGNRRNFNQGGEVQVWDLQTKKYLQAFTGHTSGVTCLAFSPDGTRLATGSVDQTVKVWDARAEQKPRILSFDDNARSYLSPDGNYFARVGLDSTMKLWNVVTGQETGTWKVPGAKRGIFPTFSPDGKHLAALDPDGVARVWDVTGQEERTFSFPTQMVYELALSPGGKRLAGAGGPVPLVWDVGSRGEAFRIRAPGLIGYVKEVVFSHDGKTLAGVWVPRAGNGGREVVKVWDATSGKETHHLEGHANSIKALAFSPAGRYLASAALDQRVKVWDLNTGREAHTLKGHFDMVFSVAWSPDGRRLATGSGDNTVKVWDAASGEELLTLRHGSAVYSVAFSPDGRRLMSGDGWNVKVWSAPPDPNGTAAEPPR
jgi:WD40 repeat protein/serine/threonine protein kinase